MERTYHSRNSRISVKNTTDSFNAVQVELHLDRISGTRDLLPVKYELLKKQVNEHSEVNWILISQKTKITQEDLNYNFNSYFLGEEGLHTFKVKVHFNDECFIESEELNYTYQLPEQPSTPLEIQDVTYNDNCVDTYSFSLNKQELIQLSGLGSRESEVQSLYLQFLNGTQDRAGVIKGIVYDYFETLGEEKTIDFNQSFSIIGTDEQTPNGSQGEANFKYKFILKNGTSTELKSLSMYKNCLNDDGGGIDPYPPGPPICSRCFSGENRYTNPIENNYENIDYDKIATIFKRKYNSDQWCILKIRNNDLNLSNHGYSEHEIFNCRDVNNGHNFIDQLQENELEDTIKIMNGPYNTTFKFQLINFQNRFEDVHTIDISGILIDETIFTANFSTFVNIQNLYVSEELYNKIHSGQISVELRNDYFQIYMSPGHEPNKILLPTGINWQQVIKKK